MWVIVIIGGIGTFLFWLLLVGEEYFGCGLVYFVFDLLVYEG